MQNNFNDSPIEKREQDLYGITPFSQALAKSIVNIKNPVGTTIALNGPWGSGKSSAVNLIRAELNKAQDTKLVITEFNCLWFRGEEALARAFLQQLTSVLGAQLGKKAKKLLFKLANGITQVALVCIPPSGGGGLINTLIEKANSFFSKEQSLEEVFKIIWELLEKEQRRFLIIIDDMDRLSSDEVLAIFRLIKTVGRLPNVMYLLAYDRQLVEKAIKEKIPSEEQHFLEKIVQASFDLPTPINTDLINAVFTVIQEICGASSEYDTSHFRKIFSDIVVPHINLPRDIARFKNIISFTWPAVAGEVNLGDFIGLEIIRLYEPKIYSVINNNRYLIINNGINDINDINDIFSILLVDVDKRKIGFVKQSLGLLFPQLHSIKYKDEDLRQWSSDRRICSQEHCDSYFRLNPRDNVLSCNDVDELINNAGDRNYIKTKLIGASKVKCKSGLSMVPIYLNELINHADRIKKEDGFTLIKTLFEIYDDIDLLSDAMILSGAKRMTTTSLYEYLMVKLINTRVSLNESTRFYLTALQSASLGWIESFTDKACSKDEEIEPEKLAEEHRLILKDALPELKKIALDKILKAKANGILLIHKNLVFILSTWITCMDGDATEVHKWTDALLDNRNALIIFAEKTTIKISILGTEYYNKNGCIDKNRETVFLLRDDSEIIDTLKLHKNIVKLKDNKELNDHEKEIINNFLYAWDTRQFNTFKVKN